MPERYPLRLRAEQPLLPGGVHAGDEIIPDPDGSCVWLVRRLPADCGPWLAHLLNGHVTPLTLSHEEAVEQLTAATAHGTKTARRKVKG